MCVCIELLYVSNQVVGVNYVEMVRSHKQIFVCSYLNAITCLKLLIKSLFVHLSQCVVSAALSKLNVEQYNLKVGRLINFCFKMMLDWCEKHQFFQEFLCDWFLRLNKALNQVGL